MPRHFLPSLHFGMERCTRSLCNICEYLHLRIALSNDLRPWCSARMNTPKPGKDNCLVVSEASVVVSKPKLINFSIAGPPKPAVFNSEIVYFVLECGCKIFV